MKVEVVSKEIIKPSSPTPPHLTSFKLSLLDQLLPPLYVPIVIFYSSDDNTPFPSHGQSSKSDILKKSLSETLTKFYPIAGRIKDNILVDCTKEGVDYIETKVKGVMSDFMSVDVLHQLSPSHILSDIDGAAKQAQLVVQVNIFECGGVAISVCLSHKVVDACTAMTFLNAWAANARGGVHAEEIVYPTFNAASIFPARRQLPPLEPDDTVKGENVITKRFIFHAARVASLRERIAASRSGGGGAVFSKHPTRVEAISALIWKTFIEIDKVKILRTPSSETAMVKSLLNFAVNLRTRLDPPLPQVSFGNIITDATAESMSTTATTNDDFAKTLDGLVGQLRAAVNEINGDYIRKLKDGDHDFLKSTSHLSGDDEGSMKVQVCWISSLSRFPFYETDFGWGKPLWIACNTSGEYKNSLLMMDTKCGTGIEAWVSLEEEDMAIFEENQQLLQYAKT